MINDVLISESSAYRLVDGLIIPVVGDIEIQAIESALEINLSSVKTHFSAALSHLSNRQDSDYRSSIKESISAVEAVCRRFVGKSHATLGDCLNEIKRKHSIHPAFEEALRKLYGFTSDAGGIRHALTDESVIPSHSDALFMLVVCSAFANLMIEKAAELNVPIG